MNKKIFLPALGILIGTNFLYADVQLVNQK